MKHLGKKFNHEGKRSDTKNHKILMEEIEDKINKWKDTLYSWIGKISVLTRAIHSFCAIHIKIPMLFFIEIEKTS
jgi:hypothetical protein